MATAANPYHITVSYENQRLEFELSGDDTIEDVKLQIYEKFKVRPSQQIITGWPSNPFSENQSLISLLTLNRNVVLSLDNTNKLVNKRIVNSESDLSNMNYNRNFQENASGSGQSDLTDVEAAVSFIAQFIVTYGDDHIPFNGCPLTEAISEACFAPIQLRKIVALYFHNENDPFSQVFCPALVSGEIRTILENSFFLVGWDVSNEIYHNALQKSLDENIDFEPAKSLIIEKHAALIILYPIENSVAVFSLLHGAKTKVNDIITALHAIEKSFKAEVENELELANIQKDVESENDIGSREFQQLMYDRLGDRDYDSFEYNEHEYLKEKIGFAKYGPPQSENGYDKKQKKKIEETYKQIRQHNNKYADWQDQVVVSFIYNCLEPVPEEKLKRSKKYPDYNPKTDISPVPIYVVRKCRGSENPCRIYIDHDNRVYNSWQQYIEDNKLDKCAMVVPKNGRYSGNEEGEVDLERHLSPACGISHTVLKGADIASTVAGLASGGVFVAALIPAITVAPVALTVAAATGIGVGIYSVGRSIANIVDRATHGENMSFANSEARGAYINIVAGTLGFVGAGATTAVSQLTARGINIGQGARVAVNTIGVINIGASGISVANSTYQVIDDWIVEQRKPSLLTVVQLSSSILFFGHAVYNFKTAGTIIEETQTQALQNYQESLRSNRHRKTFSKMLKETIRQNNGNTQAARAEIISAIRNIGNKDEVFAVLTRNNKLFNEEGIRFSVENGEIKLNGVSVDLLEFGSLTETQRTQFLIDLPSTPEPSPAQINSNKLSTKNTIQTVFEVENIGRVVRYGQLALNGCSLTNLAANLLKDFSEYIQEKVLRILKALIDSLFGAMNIDFPSISAQFFSHISRDPITVLLRFVIDFLKSKMNEYEARYEQEKEEARYLPGFNEDQFNKMWGAHPDVGKRAIYWFEQSVNVFVVGFSIDECLLRELIKYVMNMITEQVFDYCNTEEKRIEREKNTPENTNTIPCPVCGGYYFNQNETKRSWISNSKSF